MELNAAGVCADGDEEELDTLALKLGHHVTLELDSQLHRFSPGNKGKPGNIWCSPPGIR
jgi:hypothetical protein